MDDSEESRASFQRYQQQVRSFSASKLREILKNKKASRVLRYACAVELIPHDESDVSLLLDFCGDIDVAEWKIREQFYQKLENSIHPDMRQIHARLIGLIRTASRPESRSLPPTERLLDAIFGMRVQVPRLIGLFRRLDALDQLIRDRKIEINLRLMALRHAEKLGADLCGSYESVLVGCCIATSVCEGKYVSTGKYSLRELLWCLQWVRDAPSLRRIARKSPYAGIRIAAIRSLGVANSVNHGEVKILQQILLKEKMALDIRAEAANLLVENGQAEFVANWVHAQSSYSKRINIAKRLQSDVLLSKMAFEASDPCFVRVLIRTMKSEQKLHRLCDKFEKERPDFIPDVYLRLGELRKKRVQA